MLYGIVVNGIVYRDFSVKLLTIGGQCLAVEQLAEIGLNIDEKSSTADVMLNNLVYLSQQLEIEGVASDKITGQFLQENLTADDYLIITETLEILKKKRLDVMQSDNAAENV
ncbi:hypothetical protein CEP49_06780 [Mergibacter septicus]|nr:hypothetical protein CEP49_06780 [Mergibacter septicus]